MSITPDEKARRQKAFTFARTSVRLEGFEIDAQIEALYALHANGEISDETLTAEILARNGKTADAA